MTDPPFPDPDTRHVLEPGCDRCPALVDARRRIAWGTGSFSADLFVVGEAPGTGDPGADRWRGGNWTGLAYTSQHSGRLVRQLVADLGIGADDVYYTNAVKCLPTATDDPSRNREPTVEERATCRRHLTVELDRVDPTVVLPTGRHATASVLALGDVSLDGFLEVVLEPLDVPGLDAPVLPLLHPSYENVWRRRLGFGDRAAYVDAVGDALDGLPGGSLGRRRG